MMCCLVSAVVIQAILTGVHCTVQSSFRESAEMIGFTIITIYYYSTTILNGSKQPPFFSLQDLLVFSIIAAKKLSPD